MDNYIAKPVHLFPFIKHHLNNKVINTFNINYSADSLVFTYLTIYASKHIKMD